MVGVRGLEPRTSSLSVKCSNQLSYTPANKLLPDFTRAKAKCKESDFAVDNQSKTLTARGKNSYTK